MRLKTLPWWLAGLVCLLVLGAVAAGPLMSQVEQPDYVVVVKDGPIEVRAYGPMIAAEVEVRGERKAAISEGFRLIAAYIFGANRPKATIAMTAPVQQQKQEVAMTAPVTEQAAGQAWKVRFIMPRGSTLDGLPTPDDDRIKLEPIPARRMAVIRFAGGAGNRLLADRTTELRDYASRERLRTTGEPVLAFYNPPWTLPWFRRNEIMFDLAGPAAEAR